MIKRSCRLLICTVLFVPLFSFADFSPELNVDPHYNELGFFDIHLCNWPERPNFFKVLFSSTHFEKIDSMKVYAPDDSLLVQLEKSKFIQIKRKGKADKRVYILDLDAPDKVATGWYRIEIKTTDGQDYQARDYVVASRMSRATAMQPSADEERVLPVTLKWKPVAGAQYYKVFVRDAWQDKLVFTSKLIADAEVQLPDGKLEPGGYYSWAVHARDTNEHILLGDFHMGSMSKKAFFAVAE